MRKRFKVSMSWLCIFAVLFGLTPSALFADTSADTILKPGDISLSKTAERVDGEEAMWKITLTAEAADHVQSDVKSDVVLVIDKSGSMDDGKWFKDSSFEKAVDAAKDLSTQLLSNNSKSRVAIVTFNKNAEQVTGFYGSSQSDQNKLFESLSDLRKKEPDGGTNIQAGLNMARTMFSDDTSTNKVIVLLSDGDPTYSYQATSAVSDTWPNKKYDFSLSDFNYSKRIGSGGDFNLNYQDGFSWESEEYTIDGFTVKDNGIGTLSEAKIAADSGINIFSIGLGVGNNANATYVLQNCAMTDGYYAAASADDLSEIFSKIGTRILSAARNSYVIDPVGDMFKLEQVNGTLTNYTATQGTVEVLSVNPDDSNKTHDTIRWNIGDLAGGKTATLTYYITMDFSKFPDLNVDYPTNGTTTLHYTDKDNAAQAKNYDVPRVKYDASSIIIKGYTVDSQGNPINEAGEIVSRENAEVLYQEYVTEEGKYGLTAGKEYTVTAKTVEDYKLAGDNSTVVSITENHTSNIVWFAYTNYYDLTITHKVGNDILGTSTTTAYKKGTAVSAVGEYEGYIFKGVTVEPENALAISGNTVSGNMPANDVSITYQYERAAYDVNVKYVSGDTTLGTSTKSVNVGESIGTIEKKSFDGYTFSGAEIDNEELDINDDLLVTGNMPKEPVNITVNYTANDYKITINYVANKEILETKTVNNKHVGEAINPITVIDFPGHEFSFAEANVGGLTIDKTGVVNGKMPAGDVTITVYYDVQQYGLTVKHVNAVTGEEIREAQTMTGHLGQKVTLKAYESPTVSDVVYKPLPTDLTHEYTFTAEEGQTYTFKYYAPQDVTVHYVDNTTGKELQQPIQIPGYPGYTEKLTASDIKVDVTVTGDNGQTTVTQVVYSPELSEYDYVFTEGAGQTYTFYYNPASSVHKVTVNYLENGTNTVLHDPVTVTGLTGTEVSLTAKTISGYTPTVTSATYLITEADGQAYTFFYTKNYVPTPDPDPDPLPPSPPVIITPDPDPDPLPPTPPVLNKEDHYNYIRGYVDGTVRPENNINREEVATIFYRLMTDASRDEYFMTYNSFSDVNATIWSNKYISTLENAGIINGYEDGTFRPDNYITRAEFAAIAARFDNLDETANTMFSDITGHWAEKYITSAANKGWIKGYTDGTFRPDQFITRAEAMSFINAVLERNVNAEGLHEDAKLWPDNPTNKWYYYDVLEATNHHEYVRGEDGTETWETVLPEHIYR